MSTMKKPSGASPPTTRSGAILTYLVYKSGNNTDPIRRALQDRPAWMPINVEDAKRDANWNANFVWRPTWTTPKPAPSGWCRGHVNTGKRQMYNHLRAVEPLCTKDALFDTMLEYYKSINEEALKYIPPTYLIEPKTKDDPAAWPGWKQFEEHFRRCAADPTCKNLWLIKPTSLNRGIGIEVMKDLDDITSFLVTKARQASMGIQPVWVLQKYIENPLLFRGRKFDFRVWVLVTDSGDVFMHAPGYIRTSSESFDLGSTDRFAHLTNYCQQVNATSFGKFEEGNTLSFLDLEEYLTTVVLPELRKSHSSPIPSETPPATTALESDVPPGVSPTGTSKPSKKKTRTNPNDKSIHLAKDGEEALWGCGRHGLWGQMQSATIDAFEALRGRGGNRTQGYEENGFARKPAVWMAPPAKGSADVTGCDTDATTVTGSAGGTNGVQAGNVIGSAGPSSSRHRFELLGLDFIADADMKIYFIEVNTNPSLSYQNGWHEKFVDAMAVKMLNILFDGVYPDSPSPTEGLYTTSTPGKLRPAENWQFLMNVYSASWKLPAYSVSAGTPTGSDASKGKTAVLTPVTCALTPTPAGAGENPGTSLVKKTQPLKTYSLPSLRVAKPSLETEGGADERPALLAQASRRNIALGKQRAPVAVRQLASTSIVTLMPTALGLVTDIEKEATFIRPPRIRGPSMTPRIGRDLSGKQSSISHQRATSSASPRRPALLASLAARTDAIADWPAEGDKLPMPLYSDASSGGLLLQMASVSTALTPIPLDRPTLHPARSPLRPGSSPSISHNKPIMSPLRLRG